MFFHFCENEKRRLWEKLGSRTWSCYIQIRVYNDSCCNKVLLYFKWAYEHEHPLQDVFCSNAFINLSMPCELIHPNMVLALCHWHELSPLLTVQKTFVANCQISYYNDLLIYTFKKIIHCGENLPAIGFLWLLLYWNSGDITICLSQTLDISICFFPFPWNLRFRGWPVLLSQGIGI